MSISSNFGESGSRHEVSPQGEFQTSDTLVKSKLDNDNHKSCSQESRFLAWLEPEYPNFHTCLHEYLLV